MQYRLKLKDTNKFFGLQYIESECGSKSSTVTTIDKSKYDSLHETMFTRPQINFVGLADLETFIHSMLCEINITSCNQIGTNKEQFYDFNIFENFYDKIELHIGKTDFNYDLTWQVEENPEYIIDPIILKFIFNHLINAIGIVNRIENLKIPEYFIQDYHILFKSFYIFDEIASRQKDDHIPIRKMFQDLGLDGYVFCNYKSRNFEHAPQIAFKDLITESLMKLILNNKIVLLHIDLENIFELSLNILKDREKFKESLEAIISKYAEDNFNPQMNSSSVPIGQTWFTDKGQIVIWDGTAWNLIDHASSIGNRAYNHPAMLDSKLKRTNSILLRLMKIRKNKLFEK